MVRGSFPHRVTVQARTETSDGHDGYTESWAAVHTRIPARVKPLQGRDLERARQIDPRISHEVAVPFWRAYQADLDGGRARLVYHLSSLSTEDRTFEIVSAPVDTEEAHIELVMQAREAA